MNNFKQKAIVKAFSALPVWGKIAVPAVAIILIAMFFKTIKLVFWIAVLAVVGILISRAFRSFKAEE